MKFIYLIFIHEMFYGQGIEIEIPSYKISFAHKQPFPYQLM